MRPPRSLARLPASLSAPSVASTEVNTTEISSLEPVSSLSGRAGTPVTGAIILSRASAIGFRPPSYEGRTGCLKKSLERDKEIVKKTLAADELACVRGRFEHRLQGLLANVLCRVGQVFERGGYASPGMRNSRQCQTHLDAGKGARQHQI